MALAANQARLLTLTSRMHDLENNVMSLSATKMVYASQSIQVSQTYNSEMTAAENIKGVEVVVGRTPMQKTRQGSVNVDVTGRTLVEHGYTLKINNQNDVQPINNGGNVGTFDMNSFDYDSHIHLVPGQTFDSPSLYTQKVAEFLNTYGSGNFKGLSDDEAARMVKSPAIAASLGITEQQYYQIQNLYRSAMTYLPPSGDPGQVISRVATEATQTPDLDPSKAAQLTELMWKADKGWSLGLAVNEKNILSTTWNTELDNAAKNSGLDPVIFKQAARNGGSITAEEIQKLKGKYYVDYIGESTVYNGYSSAKANALNQYQLSPEYKDYLATQDAGNGSGGSDNGGTNITMADLMNMTGVQIASLIATGKVTLEKDGTAVGVPSELQDSTIEYYTEYENIYGMDYSARDNAKSAAKRKYDTATAELSKKDKAIDMQMTQSNTELSACNKEYDSVKSLIENNVEKGFKQFS